MRYAGIAPANVLPHLLPLMFPKILSVIGIKRSFSISAYQSMKQNADYCGMTKYSHCYFCSFMCPMSMFP